MVKTCFGYSYEKLVSRFLQSGYQCLTFSKADTISEDVPALFFRHDVDVDLDCALKLAEQENELGVSSTYFIMLTSDFYNAMTARSVSQIKQIIALGHSISLHFDPTVYQDSIVGLKAEILLFESLFQVPINIISLHKPSPIFLGGEEKIAGVEHTYMPKYFKAMEYVSDSMGCFKYGSPFDRQAFLDKKPMHVLLHPLWWTISAPHSRSCVDRLLKYKHQVALRYADHVLFDEPLPEEALLEGVEC